MKTFTKKAVMAAIIAVVSVLVISCGTTREITVDRNIPKKESAVVFFPDTFIVQRFNGEDVSKKWKSGFLQFGVQVTVPAGESKIDFDLYSDWGHRVFRVKDLEVIYNFEAGKTYTLTFVPQKDGDWDGK
jgi:hypothetical protein